MAKQKDRLSSQYVQKKITAGGKRHLAPTTREQAVQGAVYLTQEQVQSLGGNDDSTFEVTIRVVS